MIISLKLNNWVKRVVAIAVLAVASTALGYVTLTQFIINTLSEDDAYALRSTLIQAAAYFPQSARMQARMAKVELAETMGDEADLARAESAALQAVKLSPWSSNNHMLLASVRNVQGELEAAEASMRQAVKLAPYSAQAHWQLANLLVRQDKSEEAIREFQSAVAYDSSARLLPGAVDVVWNISEANVEKLSQVAGNDPKNRLFLAQYLLKQSRPNEAAATFESIAQKDLLNLPGATEFINALAAAGNNELAKKLWEYRLTGETPTPGQLLYNGGFEKDMKSAVTPFDWKIARSEFAVLVVDTKLAHSGNRSLRINLSGRDTTVLGKELGQTVLVQPGRRYRLECFVKTEKLVTTEGVFIVVADPATGAQIASSQAFTTGSNDWKPYAVEFTAPASPTALLVTIRRTPRFSYDEPMKGTIWLDDFTLSEMVTGK